MRTDTTIRLFGFELRRAPAPADPLTRRDADHILREAITLAVEESRAAMAEVLREGWQRDLAGAARDHVVTYERMRAADRVRLYFQRTETAGGKEERALLNEIESGRHGAIYLGGREAWLKEFNRKFDDRPRV